MTLVPSVTDLDCFASDPIRYFGYSRVAMHSLPQAELEQLQLAAVQLRFESLLPHLPVLQTMAADQGITEVASLDDAAPLLFPHTVYKSYPVSLLLGNRFDQLTRWLDRLTTLDLSTLDVSGCDSIDSWLELLDATTELRLAHSSGTTGAMSFVPHSRTQYDRLYEIVRLDVIPDRTPEGIDVVWPSFRTGRSGIARHATAMAEQLAGTPDRFHTLHQGLLSADVMFLAGRLRAAAAKGEAARVEIPAALARRKAEFDDALRSGGAGMAEFVERLADTIGGRRIASLSTWDVFHGMAEAGSAQNLTGLFAPDSVVFPGGGSKAGVLPDNWADKMARFAGVPALQFVYAMVEVIALNLQCSSGGYHLEPWLVFYLLDEHTGRPLPRAGTQSGRAAFLDLTADIHWGGFVTGDRVTATWSPCPCGRTTPRIHPEISRFGGASGDDKITCAASTEALDDALDFLSGALS
ncbi:hypothetical protein AB0P21_18630 [Kribbella sp. NPDC056861]|uniref:hypothetical protein n=1 Tax=Kribbella sp. NPDC056861 TaxID=3154857 RepID=UPI003413C147